MNAPVSTLSPLPRPLLRDNGKRKACAMPTQARPKKCPRLALRWWKIRFCELPNWQSILIDCEFSPPVEGGEGGGHNIAERMRASHPQVSYGSVSDWVSVFSRPVAYALVRLFVHAHTPTRNVNEERNAYEIATTPTTTGEVGGWYNLVPRPTHSQAHDRTVQ